MPTVTNSPTPPPAPADGDLWFNTTTGREYVWYIGVSGAQWVQTQPSGGAVTTRAVEPVPAAPARGPTPFDVTRAPTITVSQIPPNAPLVGDLWWDTVSGREYIFYDDGNSRQWVVTQPGGGGGGGGGSSGSLLIRQGNGVLLVPNPITSSGLVSVDDDYITHLISLATGIVRSVVAGAAIGVDSTDPANPVVSLADIIAAAGPIGDAGHVARVTVNAKGQITAVAAVAITPAAIGAAPASGGGYVAKSGDTMTGPLVVQMPGAVSSYILIDQPTNNTNRPVLILSKQGTVVGQISADGSSLGALYYEAIGANALHDFFVQGALTFTIVPGGAQVNGTFIATGSTQFGANTSGISHNFLTTNNVDLMLYSDTAGEIVIEAFDHTTPTTKYTLNLNKYGGGIKLPGIINNPFIVSGANSYLEIQSTTAAADHKRQRIGAFSDGSLRFQQINDAGAQVHYAQLRSDGWFQTDVGFTTPGSVSAVTGSFSSDLSGYALWSSPGAGAQPHFYWNSSGFTVDQQKWTAYVPVDGKLHFAAIADNGTIQNEIVFNRDGTIAGIGAAISVGTAPPGSPQPGALWWNSDGSKGGGQLYVYYNDGNSSQWVPAAASPAGQLGWRSLNQQTVSGVAQVDFTNLPADVNDIEFYFDVTPSNNDVALVAQFFDGGGAIDATSGHYGHSVAAGNNGIAAGASIVGTSSTSSGYTSGMVLNYNATNNQISNLALGGISGTIRISNIRDTTRPKRMTWDFVYLNGGNTLLIGGNGMGWRNIAGAITGVRFFFAAAGAISGTVAGTIRLRGGP